jgi:sec-independent protein translocase protein TatA
MLRHYAKHPTSESEDDMGDLGVPELLIILAIALAIFGPGKIAGLGKALGTSLKEFRRSVRDDEPGSNAEHPATNNEEVPATIR